MTLAAELQSSPPPVCRPAQLRLSVDDGNGEFNGMSHSGIELSIRNLGAGCTLPALPKVVLLSRAGRALPAEREAPVGMHPGPVMLPVVLGGGHRAATTLRWVSGPVFPANRRTRARFVTVGVGGGVLKAPLKALLYGPIGRPVTFQQAPLRVMEGMPEG